MPWGRQTQPNHEGFPYPLPARMAGARDAHAPVTASGTRPTSVPPGGSGPPTGSRGPTRYYGAGAHTGGTREGAFRPRAQEAAGQTTAQGRDPAAPGCRRPVREPTAVELQRAEQAATAESTDARTHARTHTRRPKHGRSGPRVCQRVSGAQFARSEAPAWGVSTATGRGAQGRTAGRGGRCPAGASRRTFEVYWFWCVYS